MFGYIKGIIEEIAIDYLIIEANGVGFKLTTSQFTNKNVKVGEMSKLYTKMIVREDDIFLVGFYDKNEMRNFELLTSVSKVGPKVAFSILSTYDVMTLESIIASSDVNLLSKASGVGKKTAERIIVELRDKIARGSTDTVGNIFVQSDARDEALDALVSLGFSKSESSTVIDKILSKNSDISTNDLIKKALSNLGKF